MINPSQPPDWRQGRRRSAQDAIVRAAWVLVGEVGLAGLSLRDLARQAGITTPTVYAYFESKNAIYDAMFGQAATEFAEKMAEPIDGDEPGAQLVAYVHRFVEFCIGDPARYQLLFQRTLPGFEPSPEAYAPAILSLANTQRLLVLNRVTEARHLDLWTALITGLVDQQVSNDPGGNRWTGLIGESVDMFLAHCQRHPAPKKPSPRPNPTGGTRS